MNTLSILRHLAVLTCAGALISGAASGQPARSQAELAAELLSDDLGRVVSALDEVPLSYRFDGGEWFFPSDYTVSEELAAALAHAAEHHARNHLTGCIVADNDVSPELALDFLHFMLAMDDPVAIPALIQLACLSGYAEKALLAFGPIVMDPVTEWAGSPEAHAHDVLASMRILKKGVEQWGDSLPDAVSEAIKGVADTYLDVSPTRFEPWEWPFVLEHSIRLASVLGGPELSSKVQGLASGEAAWTSFDELAASRGSSVAAFYEAKRAELRQLARRALAGPIR